MKINKLYEELLNIENVVEMEQYLREHEINLQDFLDYIEIRKYEELDNGQTIQNEKSKFKT